MAKKASSQNIFVSWFLLYHGIAFLKHILAKFYDKTLTPDGPINLENLSQEDCEKIWDRVNNGFYFDKIYIIVPPEKTRLTISSITPAYRKEALLRDEIITASGSYKLWEKILDQNFSSIKDEISFIKQNFSSEEQELILSQYWRNIQHYSIADQIWWLENYSNLPKNYFKRFNFIKIRENEIKSFYDYKQVAEVLLKKIRKLAAENPEAKYIFQIGVSGHVITVAFNAIAHANLLPVNSRFIEAYDVKNTNPGHRFKKFHIHEIPTNLFEDIETSLKLYHPKPSSPKRLLIVNQFNTYIKQGFAILLLGERGIGKSHIAQNHSTSEKINFVPVNCASFINSEIAEAELFGYRKGAFTDAKKDKKGLIEEANNGILFLDEIHTLPKNVQFKLMRAFATDEQNRMTIRRIGDSKERKIKLKALILATNRTIDELKQVLLPDFFDRIAQLIIELPPLRETPEEIIPGFKEIWKGLKFETAYPFDDYPGKDKRLLNWIKSLPLYGNYRDLQRIAINYKAYLEFDKKTISLLPEKSAFEFTKNQFEKYMLNSETHQQPNPYFDENKTPNQALALFKKDYVAWAKKRFGTLKNAVRHFNQLKENNITYRTLQNWSKTK